MSIPENDVIAIEQAGETLVRAINAGDMSALTSFFTANAAVLAPARPPVTGEKVTGFFRSFALQVSGVRLMSDDMAPFGPDAVRDIGTLSMRAKQPNTERVSYKYLILWERVGTTWKLSSLAWNRTSPNRRAQAPAAAADNGM